jgi:hypothetical protein
MGYQGWPPNIYSTLVDNFGGKNRPNTRLTYTPGPDCISPVSPGATYINPFPVCSGKNFVLSLQNSIGSSASYQWQSSTDSLTWTNFGISASSVSTSQTTEKFYRCLVTCAGTTVSSIPVKATMNPFYKCYCDSYFSAKSGADVTNVSLGSLNNSSVCQDTARGVGSIPGKYSNFVGYSTVPEINLVSNQSFSINITECEGYPYDNAVAIYIDYNRNGQFTDANEKVYLSSQVRPGNRTETGSFVIPGSAQLGLTGMRIVGQETWNVANINPCGYGSWGETEDYIVNIIPPTVPLLVAAPQSLAFGYVAPGTTAVNNFLLTGYNLAQGPVKVKAGSAFRVSLSTAGPFTDSLEVTYSIPGFTGTPVYVQFAPTGVPAVYTGTVNITGGGAPATSVALTGNSDLFINYCSSIPTSANDEEIYSVTINGAVKTSNCTNVAPGPGSILKRYSNFYPLGSLTTIQHGQTVGFSIIEDECDGAPYKTNGCAIWIDYTQDGDFNDAGEKVFVENSLTISPRTIAGSFIVPSSAKTGLTAMRIIVAQGKSGTGLTPCLSYTYGETEDYKITISPAPLVVTGTVTHVTCHGGGTGAISTLVTGGTGPYTYL